MSDDRVKTLQVMRTSRLSGFYRQSPERQRARGKSSPPSWTDGREP